MANLSVPALSPADPPGLLPVYNLDSLRVELTALLALKVKPEHIQSLLRIQNAPAAAWIEALVVMGQPSTPWRLVKALLDAAARPELQLALAAACQRWGVHPASLVASHTRGPLGLGQLLGLPEDLIRSFPGKRRAHEDPGHWAPPADFLGAALPEGLVLQQLHLTLQPRLEHLPERLSVQRKVILDRLPRLERWGDWLASFRGSLGLRDCPALPALPSLARLGDLTVDSQPWRRFPEAPLTVGQAVVLQRMPYLEALDPGLVADRLVLAHCPRVRSLPEFPCLGVAPPPSTHAGPTSSWDPWNPAELIQPARGLAVIGCHALPGLPPGYRQSGTLTLQDCWSFEALPEGLQTDGLVLRRLPALRALPEGLHVRGHLVLEGLGNLTALPRGLKVDGDLVVNRMAPGSLALPRDMTLGGRLKLHPLDARLPWPERPCVLPTLGAREGL